MDENRFSLGQESAFLLSLDENDARRKDYNWVNSQADNDKTVMIHREHVRSLCREYFVHPQTSSPQKRNRPRSEFP